MDLFNIFEHRCRRKQGAARCIMDSRHRKEVGCLFTDPTMYTMIKEHPELLSESFQKWLWR